MDSLTKLKVNYHASRHYTTNIKKSDGTWISVIFMDFQPEMRFMPKNALLGINVKIFKIFKILIIIPQFAHYNYRQCYCFFFDINYCISEKIRKEFVVITKELLWWHPESLDFALFFKLFWVLVENTLLFVAMHTNQLLWWTIAFNLTFLITKWSFKKRANSHWSYKKI